MEDSEYYKDDLYSPHAVGPPFHPISAPYVNDTCAYPSGMQPNQLAPFYGNGQPTSTPHPQNMDYPPLHEPFTVPSQHYMPYGAHSFQPNPMAYPPECVANNMAFVSVSASHQQPAQTTHFDGPSARYTPAAGVGASNYSQLASPTLYSHNQHHPPRQFNAASMMIHECVHHPQQHYHYPPLFYGDSYSEPIINDWNMPRMVYHPSSLSNIPLQVHSVPSIRDRLEELPDRTKRVARRSSNILMDQRDLSRSFPPRTTMAGQPPSYVFHRMPCRALVVENIPKSFTAKHLSKIVKRFGEIHKIVTDFIESHGLVYVSFVFDTPILPLFILSCSMT